MLIIISLTIFLITVVIEKGLKIHWVLRKMFWNKDKHHGLPDHRGC